MASKNGANNRAENGDRIVTVLAATAAGPAIAPAVRTAADIAFLVRSGALW